MKQCALYARVSSPDESMHGQLIQLREIARQRGLEVIAEFSDLSVSGTRAKRPGLDSALSDARKGKFTVMVILSLDRLGKHTKHLLEVIQQLNSLGIDLISAQEALDSSEPHGRIFLESIVKIAALEKGFRAEAIKAGMRRAKLDGRYCGRAPLNVDRQALVHDRLSAGISLTQVAKKYSMSRASVVRFCREAMQRQFGDITGYPPHTEKPASVESVA